MKLTHDLGAVRARIERVLHLDALKSASGVGQAIRAEPEWAIVYRTAQGFCCIYRDTAIELREMLDVQIWAEEYDVQTYFIGL